MDVVASAGHNTLDLSPQYLDAIQRFPRWRR